MFEQEINEAIQRITRDVLQDRTLIQLTEILEEPRIPERFKAFFKTEAQWWIYTESVARARDRRFDFSHPELDSLLSYLEQVQLRHSRFERDDFTAVLDSAVKLTYNYICRPQTTLKWYVFRGEPTKPLGETLLRMDAFLDYPYFRTVFAEWVERKKEERPTFDNISAREFERIVRRIDDQILLSCTIDGLLNLMESLYDFVGEGEERAVPIEAMIVFFDDKNIRRLVNFLERERGKRTHISQATFVSLMEELLNSSDDTPDADFSAVYQDDALDEVVRELLEANQKPVAEHDARHVADSAAESLSSDGALVIDPGSMSRAERSEEPDTPIEQRPEPQQEPEPTFDAQTHEPHQDQGAESAKEEREDSEEEEKRDDRTEEANDVSSEWPSHPVGSEQHRKSLIEEALFEEPETDPDRFREEEEPEQVKYPFEVLEDDGPGLFDDSDDVTEPIIDILMESEDDPSAENNSEQLPGDEAPETPEEEDDDDDGDLFAPVPEAGDGTAVEETYMEDERESISRTEAGADDVDAEEWEEWVIEEDESDDDDDEEEEEEDDDDDVRESSNVRKVAVADDDDEEEDDDEDVEDESSSQVGRLADVRKHIDAVVEKKVLKKIFGRNRDEYERVLDSLNTADTWREASRVLDELFIRYDVDPYSRTAIRFTDAVYGRYLTPVTGE